MSLNDALIMVITHTRNQTLKLVADLSDEQLAVQPGAKNESCRAGCWGISGGRIIRFCS